MKFNQFDLNLFIALDTLLEEQSVSKAAERLGITQPGMSHILGKLREEYNDPIMVRRNNRMELTSFARELAGPVKELLRQAEKLINLNQRFDPATTEHQFKLSLEDAIQTAISAPLYERMSKLAPHASLHVLRDGNAEDLANDRVDLILSHHRFSAPFYSELVYATPFVSIARADHPLIGGDLTLAKFVACEHAVIFYDEQSLDSVEEEIDRQLQIAGLSRSKSLRISSYIAAKRVAESTDLIAAIPASFATRYCSEAKLAVYRPPVPLAPIPVYSVWHEQNHLHPAHRWFRALVRDVMQVEHEEIPYSAPAVMAPRRRSARQV